MKYMVNIEELRKLVEAVRDAANAASVDRVLQILPEICELIPRLPDYCFAQPGVVVNAVPSIILDWRSADKIIEKETGEEYEGAVCAFDISPERSGFWAQRFLQRITINHDLKLFADKTAVRTDTFERDADLIRIGFRWLEDFAVKSD